MIRQTGNMYQRSVVQLDGTDFRNCTFDNCRLVFRGERPTGLVGCTFINVTWAFDGSAATTLAFLSALHAGGGTGGKELVERTIASIRDGTYLKAPGISE